MACRWFLDRSFYCVSTLLSSCLNSIDAFMPCVEENDVDLLCYNCPVTAPGNQMEHFYRYGQVDECKFTWKNMYLCYRASMMDEEKRQDFLKDTPLDASNGPHVTDVWEKKETPGW
ncbi:Protein of unknown function DUF3128 [Phytophthora cactorum]|nr:Protein of unknown function DUF3128 [Phytophthora cactorum]